MIENTHSVTIASDLPSMAASVEMRAPFLDQEIIIIDCSNNKDLKEKISLKYPKIKYILSPINLGYGAGNNLGIKHSTFNNVLILNPDALMDENSKKELLNYINDIKDYGILCPNLSNDQCKIFSRSNNYNPVKIDWKSKGISLCSLSDAFDN